MNHYVHVVVMHAGTEAEEHIKMQLKDFCHRFGEMVIDVQHAFEQNEVSPKRVIFILKLPDLHFITRNEHMEFLDSLSVGGDILDLFNDLNKYWDHLNYYLLDKLISAPRIEMLIACAKIRQKLQDDMKKYKKDVEHFRECTTLEIYCKVVIRQKNIEVPPKFMQLVSIHEQLNAKSTLQDVEKFRLSFAHKHQLQDCLMFFKTILFGCVEITWIVPEMFIVHLHWGWAETCLPRPEPTPSSIPYTILSALGCRELENVVDQLTAPAKGNISDDFKKHIYCRPISKDMCAYMCIRVKAFNDESSKPMKGYEIDQIYELQSSAEFPVIQTMHSVSNFSSTTTLNVHSASGLLGVVFGGAVGGVVGGIVGGVVGFGLAGLTKWKGRTGNAPRRDSHSINTADAVFSKLSGYRKRQNQVFCQVRVKQEYTLGTVAMMGSLPHGKELDELL